MNLINFLTVNKKVYCTLFGKEVRITKIDTDKIYISDDFTTIELQTDGSFFAGGEPVIFPTEKERDWKTYIENYSPIWDDIKDNIILKEKYITIARISTRITTENEKITESAIAKFKIFALIEEFYGGYPTLKEISDPTKSIYQIEYEAIEHRVMIACTLPMRTTAFPSFKDRDMAKKFISREENLELLKTLWMIN